MFDGFTHQGTQKLEHVAYPGKGYEAGTGGTVDTARHGLQIPTK
jgi:hypothetical protein